VQWFFRRYIKENERYLKCKLNWKSHKF
jgi:hypothetical protein